MPQNRSDFDPCFLPPWCPVGWQYGEVYSPSDAEYEQWVAEMEQDLAGEPADLPTPEEVAEMARSLGLDDGPF